MFCVFGWGWGKEAKHIKHGHSDRVFCVWKVGGTEGNVYEHTETQKHVPIGRVLCIWVGQGMALAQSMASQ